MARESRTVMLTAARGPCEQSESIPLLTTECPEAAEPGGGPAEHVAGESAAIREVLAQARRVAATGSTVLVLGETGTGKELIASYVHAHSERRHREMICVNCAAIPSTLIESELFGREKGAYTDAFTQQAAASSWPTGRR